MQHHKRQRDHDDKRRRVDEPVSPVFTVAQDEVSTLSTVQFDSETRDNEIDRKEWRKRSGLDHRSSILHSVAWWATTATAQGGKDEPFVTCREA